VEQINNRKCSENSGDRGVWTKTSNEMHHKQIKFNQIKQFMKKQIWLQRFIFK